MTDGEKRNKWKRCCCSFSCSIYADHVEGGGGQNPTKAPITHAVFPINTKGGWCPRYAFTDVLCHAQKRIARKHAPNHESIQVPPGHLSVASLSWSIATGLLCTGGKAVGRMATGAEYLGYVHIQIVNTAWYGGQRIPQRNFKGEVRALL